MAEVTIAPASADRFDDAEHALTGGGDGASCQCQWWTITNAQWQASSPEERTELLRAEMVDGPPPALIAYVDGEAAGWVRVGPRAPLQRVARTREFAEHLATSGDDTWAVTCFVVRREHRGIGLNAQLLAAAVEYARDRGAQVLEAYPIDTTVGKKSSNNLFRGVLSVFLAAGFKEVARPKPDRAIVSLSLG
jgi:GNAT superfamily N-acetyltransferase